MPVDEHYITRINTGQHGEFATKRKINLVRQNPEVFEVLAGLQPGEKVITSSYDNYCDNIEKLVLK